VKVHPNPHRKSKRVPENIISINIIVTGLVTWHHEPAPLQREGLVNQVYATKYKKNNSLGTRKSLFAATSGASGLHLSILKASQQVYEDVITISDCLHSLGIKNHTLNDQSFPR